tara:strand:+ start:39307 stop:40848 length:1542 start_codon:yes stop_codon:yes gene_type:complete
MLAEAEKSDPQAVRFRAFVSYSHADAAIAQKLHRKIETYRLPRHLQADQMDCPDNGRLGRIFRDREDLPAAEDLSESVKQALAGSQVLVVICSPDAKASIWVAREIELFRALHPGRPVLAALVRGEPEEAFPAPLLNGAEPLAADLRKEGDGWRLGILKIIAGIAEVPLDALVQRDATRRIRRVMAVTGGTLVALLAMIGMTIFAIQSRNEAQHQQAEAEGLVEYMLTDLREKMDDVGRLEIMESVNERAMDYYSQQDGLSPLQASIVRLMAEDDERRGDSESALKKYLEALGITEKLLLTAPENSQRRLDHAQSHNAIGGWFEHQGQYGKALAHYRQSLELAQRTDHESANASKWLQELSYTNANLCSSYLLQGSNVRRAKMHCRKALIQAERLTKLRPESRTARLDLAIRYAWLADTDIALGNIEDGLNMLKTHIKIIDEIVALEPANRHWQEQQMRSYAGYAMRLAEHEEREISGKYVKLAMTLAEALEAHDPTNEEWSRWLTSLSKMQN